MPTPPTDFGPGEYRSALVNVTNACNLDCRHCFVFRSSNPNRPKDKMDGATMLEQLGVLRDRHRIRSMLFMGGEPMIRKEFVLRAVRIFEESTVVTNGTYGVPSVPGHLVSISLDGPEEMNDSLRGEGVFARVSRSVHERPADDGTTVMLQMAVTRENQGGLTEFIDTVRDWPIDGVAFTFYVPQKTDRTALAWEDLRDRDAAVRRVIELKERHPVLIKSHPAALELMLSDVAIESTGERGEHCLLRGMLPLYVGEGGQFERTFCCYGNDVDCSRCGSYGVFNAAYRQQTAPNLTSGASPEKP